MFAFMKNNLIEKFYYIRKLAPLATNQPTPSLIQTNTKILLWILGWWSFFFPHLKMDDASTHKCWLRISLFLSRVSSKNVCFPFCLAIYYFRKIQIPPFESSPQCGHQRIGKQEIRCDCIFQWCQILKCLNKLTSTTTATSLHLYENYCLFCSWLCSNCLHFISTANATLRWNENNEFFCIFINEQYILLIIYAMHVWKVRYRSTFSDDYIFLFGRTVSKLQTEANNHFLRETIINCRKLFFSSTSIDNHIFDLLGHIRAHWISFYQFIVFITSYGILLHVFFLYRIEQVFG